jgi:hypothetical protein
MNTEAEIQLENLILSSWLQESGQIKLTFEIENLSQLPNSAIKLKVAKSSMNLTIKLLDEENNEIHKKFQIEKFFKKIVPA